MNGKILVSMTLLTMMVFSNVTRAEPLQIDKRDGIEKVLRKQMDKRVTVKLVSGDELTGTVKAVNRGVTHLNAIAGQEYFDAVIVNEDIAALIIRVRDR